MTRGTTQMQVNGLLATLNMPKATASRYDSRGKEIVGSLAQGAPVTVYSVDDFPGCPVDWMRSDPSIGLRTYFFASKVGHMVWLDFNANQNNACHVGVIISAQGVNAITGRHVTHPICMEQYKRNCPNHNKPFSGNRYCADCGYEWPGQNYLASNVTQGQRLWIDGFRGEGGVTREFMFTEETERGVAANIIGAARVDAFSLAFYLSKEPKPAPTYATRGGGFLGGGHLEGADGGPESFALESTFQPSSAGATRGATRSASKRVEVGAGAMVNQTIADDTQTLDFWQESPTALIRIYYCSPEDLADIIGSGGAGGPAPTGGSFLGGVPTGNKTF